MRSILRKGARVGATVALMLAASLGANTVHQVLAGNKAAAGANVDWPRFGNTTDNTRFSTLAQINTTNVSRLGLAWTQQQGKNLVGWETDPVVVNGVMYITTNTDQVRALDAANGHLIWQYTPKVNFYLAIAGGGGGVPTNRGVAVVNGRVYLLTFDNQLIALQASTGEKLWSSQVADPNQGYSETSPATYWNGLLFVGSAESDAGLRGFVAAYSAATGKQVWRFYTVPAAGQGWMPKVGQHGGGDVWMPSVIDNTTGILYFGTGNPSPDVDNRVRPGCNPWVDSTVALDARTGKFIWAHTEVCPDVWDYDSHQPPILFNLSIKGETVRAVGHGNKSGLFFVYNALTGQVLAKSPYLGTYSVPHLFPTAKGVVVCPGAGGGIEYSPPAYSPDTEMAYEPGTNSCATFTLGNAADTARHHYGQPDFGGTFTFGAKSTGFMAGIDVNTGKIAWRTELSQGLNGGALATAGGLVFSGAGDGHFYAFDARTGTILWSPKVGLGCSAAPMTYEVNGTQYVAIALGASFAFPGQPPPGATFAVFKLNGKPVKPFPAVTIPSSPSTAPSLVGMTKIGKWIYANAPSHHVVIVLTAAATSDNNGFNFDGYANGKATFTVPAGWTIDWIFSNKSTLPHSAAFTTNHTVPAKQVPSLFGGIGTPLPNVGVGPKITQYVSFVEATPGTYYISCLVSGHLQAGMWDTFVVSATAAIPSLTVT